MNIIVFDTTQTRWPWLAAWWRIGSALAAAGSRADVAIGADNWASALRQVVDVVRSHSTAESPARIESLQFWGHGCDGAMLMAGQLLDRRSFGQNGPHHGLLRELRTLMDPSDGIIWFRGCNTFRGDEGRRFAREAADFFGVPVVGHTFIIWALQSGTHILAPGGTPCWSPGEGVRNRPRRLSFAPWTQSDSMWSAPFRTRTVPALRFAPPRF